MKEGCKIYLFRHGQTTYNRDRRFTGWKNALLTKQGQKNAETIAKKLKRKTFQVAIHTSLTRSKQTLKPVLKNHPECKTIIEDDRMIERSYGDLSGSTHEEFIKKIGHRLYQLECEGDYICSFDPIQRKKAEKLLGTEEYEVIHRGWNTPAQNGESFADVEKRVASFIKDIKKFVHKNKVNVAISAHGNSIRLFRKIIEKKSIPESIKWFIPYDKVFEYTI